MTVGSSRRRARHGHAGVIRVLNVGNPAAGSVRLRISTPTVLMWGWVGADAELSTFCMARRAKPRRLERLNGPASQADQ